MSIDLFLLALRHRDAIAGVENVGVGALALELGVVRVIEDRLRIAEAVRVRDAGDAVSGLDSVHRHGSTPARRGRE